MEIPAFDRSIRECSSILLEFGIDVYKLLQSSAKEQYEKNTLNCMLAITAIQVIYPFSFLKICNTCIRNRYPDFLPIFFDLFQPSHISSRWAASLN